MPDVAAQPDVLRSPTATTDASRHSRSWRPRRISILAAGSSILLIAAWHVISVLAGKNAAGNDLVPNIADIVRAAKGMANYWPGGLGVAATDRGGAVTWSGAVLGLIYNSLVTGYRLLAGVSLGIVVGVGLAMLVSWSRTLRALIIFPAHFARMVPMLALIPLFLLWFAGTERAAILFIGFSVFVLIFVVALNALGNVAPDHARWAASLGAGRARIYLTVIVPAALPEIRGGILLSLGLSWTTAVAAEYLGQQYGLGHIAQIADFYGQTNTLALIAFLLISYAALSTFCAARVLRWCTRWAE